MVYHVLKKNMTKKLPSINKKALIYQDKNLYVCLAQYPVTLGHVVVVWKKKVKDLHLLSIPEYDYLLEAVDAVRKAMLKALKIQKVYLVYMDEVRHVHWHLIPRYNIKGFNIFIDNPVKTVNFSLAKKIKKFLKL